MNTGTNSYNLRGRGLPFQLGSDRDVQDYLALVEQARAKQQAEYIVAPKCKLKTLRGTLLECQEVTVDDLIPEVDASGYQTAQWTILRRLVDRGHVLAKADGRG